jgi:toxin ParE1/3/4
MAKYFLTNKAVDDLSRIWEYTYEVWSEGQADKYYQMLIESCEEIAKAPEIGKSYNEIGKAILGVRVGKHIIFYRVVQLNDIEIVRILHQRMDLKNQID